MSFVTLTVYKLDNLRNQLMNNRLLVSTLYSACQLSVPCRPANATSSANGRVNSVEVRSAYNQTDPLEWMTALVEKKSGPLRLAGLTRTVWSGWPVLTILLSAHGLCYEGGAFNGRPETPRIQNKLSSKLWYMKYMKYMKYFNIWNTSHITSQNKLSFKIIPKRRSWFCSYHVFLQNYFALSYSNHV